MFFDEASDLLRVLVVGTLAYAGLLLMLRVSGKRTLTQMNAFDLVVTVALGSTLATVLLSSEVSLLEGLLALALLISLQFLISFAQTRNPQVRRLVKSEPSLLLYEGTLLRESMRKERVAENEIDAAIRESGLASRGDVYAVVLETNGRISVVPFTGAGRGVTSLQDALPNVS